MKYDETTMIFLWVSCDTVTPQWDPGTPIPASEAQSFEAAVVAGAKGDGKDAEANGGSSCWLCPFKMGENFYMATLIYIDNDDTWWTDKP